MVYKVPVYTYLQGLSLTAGTQAHLADVGDVTVSSGVAPVPHCHLLHWLLQEEIPIYRTPLLVTGCVAANPCSGHLVDPCKAEKSHWKLSGLMAALECSRRLRQFLQAAQA